MTTIATIEFRLSEMRSKYEQGRGQLELLQRQQAEKESALTVARHDLEIWRQVQILFAKSSEFAREQLKRRIEETVTAALQAVFMDDSLRFQVAIRTLGNQPAADWEVVSRYGDTEIANSPEDARGGGIVDVVSIALRLAMMELSRPKPGGPVILDEPGKHVSAEYAPNLAFFLRSYAEKTGRQIIMVTHNEALAEVADKAFRVTKNAEGVSGVAQA
ncbi:MAG: hypothetical protein ACM3X3_01645 [Betaproteobacteria bacterium]